MAEWAVEFRKHTVFMTVTLILLGAALVTHAWSHNSIADVVWIFSVILLSSAWAIYSCGQVFSYAALKGDTLLQLSTLTPLKKMLLKIIPLFTGYTLIGMGTLSGYLWGGSQSAHLSLSQAIGAMGVKILSVAALIAWGWVLARSVRNIRWFGLQLTVYGFGWILVIALPIITLISAAHTSIDSWFIGVSDAYNGLPLYVTAIPVIIENPPIGATAITLSFNVVAIIIVLVFETFCGNTSRHIESTV
ncbi:hypothetical protein [Boudabousia marimammalium]|uniref:Uncharacterized protein n=1 Tax=Boudabousia marimammalium TaxID=156892 RepID=A0A1Q5PJW5_9ACTO|nr:hypothetical protein [Boudabousia marimammalium]OKL46230.1 hypothetical protein BM477_07310 [Boudabousia marimammalium]